MVVTPALLSLAISVGACDCTCAESWLASSGTVNERMLAGSILGPPYFVVRLHEVLRVDAEAARRVDDADLALGALQRVAGVDRVARARVLGDELTGDRLVRRVRLRDGERRRVRRHLAGGDGGVEDLPAAVLAGRRERREVDDAERLLLQHRDRVGTLRGLVRARRRHELVLDRAAPEVVHARQERVVVVGRVLAPTVRARRLVLDPAVLRREVTRGRRDQRDDEDRVLGDALRGGATVVLALGERPRARADGVVLHLPAPGGLVAVRLVERRGGLPRPMSLLTLAAPAGEPPSDARRPAAIASTTSTITDRE